MNSLKRIVNNMSKEQQIKEKGHDCNMDARQRSRADRKKAKLTKSPDVTKKYSYFVPAQRMTLYSDTIEETINSLDLHILRANTVT